MKKSINEIKKLEEIGQGLCSYVYRDGNTVYKIIKANAKRAYGRYYNREALQRSINIRSDLCIYPRDIVEDEDGELKGYSMEYANLVYLYKKLKVLPFEQLEQAIKEAEDKIKVDSKNKMVFNDMHMHNIMWDIDNECIRIIDTDFFEEMDDKTEDEVLRKNLSKFALEIMSMLSDRLHYYDINNEEIVNYKKEFRQRNKEGQPVYVSEYLSILRDVIERDFEKHFNNMGEMINAIKERQEENEEMAYKRRVIQVAENNMPVKQKLARKMNNTFLRKLPFFKTFIERQMKMLPDVLKNDTFEMESDDQRKKFVDTVSGNGEYRKKDFTIVIIDRTHDFEGKEQDSTHELPHQGK